MQVDLGVDPQKSTGVNLGISSQVGLLCLSSADPMLNLDTKSDF